MKDLIKIAVIEDNKAYSRSIQEIIGVSEEMECIGVYYSAEDCSHAFQTSTPPIVDVILLDLRMPDKDGFWFVKHAKLHDGTKVVLMTAYPGGLPLDVLHEKGIDEYLEKPFSYSDLTGVLDRYAVAS